MSQANVVSVVQIPRSILNLLNCDISYLYQRDRQDLEIDKFTWAHGTLNPIYSYSKYLDNYLLNLSLSRTFHQPSPACARSQKPSKISPSYVGRVMKMTCTVSSSRHLHTKFPRFFEALSKKVVRDIDSGGGGRSRLWQRGMFSCHIHRSAAMKLYVVRSISSSTPIRCLGSSRLKLRVNVSRGGLKVWKSGKKKGMWCTYVHVHTSHFIPASTSVQLTPYWNFHFR